MTTASSLYARLSQDLSDQGTAIGVKVEQKLMPFESGYDVQPPTYATGEEGRGGRQRPTRHFALRRMDGKLFLTVLLDSIPSQANRLEELMRRRARELGLPIVGVRVGRNPGYLITQYDAPHRIYDGYFKFSKLGGQAFFTSPVGQEVLWADTFTATPLYRWSPNTLLLGGWASHADDAAMTLSGAEKNFQRAQAKIERAMEATIFGIVTDLTALEEALGKNAEHLDRSRGILDVLSRLFTVGKTQSRYDPLNASAPEGKQVSEEKLSQLGLGHILPTINMDGGYVTVQDILYHSVLKFSSLRKLYFPPSVDEAVSYAHERDVAGRVVLAALGLHLLALYLSQGTIKLRSRATLMPVSRFAKAIYLLHIQEEEALELDPKLTEELYGHAIKEAEKQGLSFEKGCLLLELDEEELSKKTPFTFKVPLAPSYVYDICPEFADGTNGR